MSVANESEGIRAERKVHAEKKVLEKKGTP